MPDGLLLAAAVRPRDAGDPDAQLGAEARGGAVGQRRGDLGRDRAVRSISAAGTSANSTFAALE